LKGGWHGGNDTLFYFVKHLDDGIESQGLKTLEEADILTFDYNNTEQAIKIIQEHKKELAAIIMEPVMGAGGAIPPREGFLETIREETEKNDILLIFDEIITGFRLGFHSAQGLFDVTPDLTTMGKIIGGGAPIGVIGGRDDILETANMQKRGKVWNGGGTFSGNPVSMVAGLATINVLEEEKNELYPKINDYGERLREEVCKIINRYNMPAIVTGFGSMSCIHWFKKPKATISSGSEIQLDGNPIMNKKLQLLLFNRGLLVRTGLGYVSYRHSNEDFTKTLKAIDESIQILSKNM
jgi:glutamate-1-semialdehyde 2,1-aminomutase